MFEITGVGTLLAASNTSQVGPSLAHGECLAQQRIRKAVLNASSTSPRISSYCPLQCCSGTTGASHSRSRQAERARLGSPPPGRRYERLEIRAHLLEARKGTSNRHNARYPGPPLHV